METKDAKFGIYSVVYGKLEELHAIKIDANTPPPMVVAICEGIASLGYILAEGKRMRNPKE